MAHYLAKAGVNVLVLEKQKFPRDKYCGDAVCKTAIEILRDMDIYNDLLKRNKAKIADAGGLVSPSGLSYVGRSLEVLGNDIPAVRPVPSPLSAQLSLTCHMTHVRYCRA
jgi:hypothetical protein